MGLESVACLIAACDQCGQVLDNGEDTELHFASAETANQAATSAEWIITGGRYLCRTCVEQAGCEYLGHDWQPWQHTGPEHLIWVRMCRGCGRIQRIGEDDQDADTIADAMAGYLLTQLIPDQQLDLLEPHNQHPAQKTKEQEQQERVSDSSAGPGGSQPPGTTRAGVQASQADPTQPDDVVGEVVVVCSVCQSDSDPYLDPAEAIHIAGVHNDLHHGSQPAAYLVDVDTNEEIDSPDLAPHQAPQPAPGSDADSGQAAR